MWVNLNDAEVAAVVAAMRKGSVVDKLCARPVLGSGAFLEVAKRNQDISVDESGTIIRGELGAYVMCWQWVSEKETGVPTAYESFGISCELASRLKARKSFRLESLTAPTDVTVEARGEYGGFSWFYEEFMNHWRLTLTDLSDGRHSWMYSEELPDDADCDTAYMMMSWLRASTHSTSVDRTPRRRNRLFTALNLNPSSMVTQA